MCISIVHTKLICSKVIINFKVLAKRASESLHLQKNKQFAKFMDLSSNSRHTQCHTVSHTEWYNQLYIDLCTYYFQFKWYFQGILQWICNNTWVNHRAQCHPALLTNTVAIRSRAYTRLVVGAAKKSTGNALRYYSCGNEINNA